MMSVNKHKDNSISSKLKELSSHGLVYGLGVALNSLLGFVLIPVYTSYFSTEMYGVFSLITLCGTLVGGLLYLGGSSALSRYYYDYTSNKGLQIIVSSTLVLTIVGALIQIILGLVFAKFISKTIFDTIKYADLISVSFATSAFTFINTTYLLLLRFENKSLLFVLLNAATFIISVVAVLLLFQFEFGLYAPFIGLAIGQLFLCCFLMLYFSKYKLSNVQKDKVVKLLKYGFPIALSGIVFYTLEWSDRFFIKKYCTLADVGIYSYGYKLGMSIQALIIIPFSLIWSQTRMKYKNDSNTSSLFQIVTTYFCVLCLCVILLFGLFSSEIISLTSKENSGFVTAELIIPLIALAQFFYGLSNIFDYGIAISNKSKYIFYVGVFTLIINTILNFILIPLYSMYGAAMVKIISYSIYICLIFIISSKYFIIKVEYKRLLPLLLVVLLFIFSSHVFSFELKYEEVLFKVLLVLLLFVYIIFVFLNKKEQSFFNKIIKLNNNG